MIEIQPTDPSRLKKGEVRGKLKRRRNNVSVCVTTSVLGEHGNERTLFLVFKGRFKLRGGGG